MSWRLRLIEPPPREGFAGELEVGDCWYETPISDTHRLYLLAPEHADRRPLVVRMPGPVHFAVYGPEIGEARIGPKGWVVTGDPPAITLSPSVHCPGVYHGYIQDGVITDDLDGRRYDAHGNQIRNGQPPG